MSELLHQFLSAYIAWVDEGAPNLKPFSRHRGLCSNLDSFMFKNCLADALEAESDLMWMFSCDGLDISYPFGGGDAYDKECAYGKIHLNEHRIAWVRAKLAQPVEV